MRGSRECAMGWERGWLGEGVFGGRAARTPCAPRAVILTAVQSLRLACAERGDTRGDAPGKDRAPIQGSGLGGGWTRGVAPGCVRARRWRWEAGGYGEGWWEKGLTRRHEDAKAGRVGGEERVQ